MTARRYGAGAAIIALIITAIVVTPTSATSLSADPDPAGSPWKGSATTTETISGFTSSMAAGTLYAADGVDGDVGWESWDCEYVHASRVVTTGDLIDFKHSSTMVQWIQPAEVFADYSMTCDGSFRFDPFGEDPPRTCAASVSASLVASGPAQNGLDILYLRSIENWSSEATLAGEVPWSIDNFSDSCGVAAIEIRTETVSHADGHMSETLTAEHLRSGAVLDGIDIGETVTPDSEAHWTSSWRYEYDGCSLNANAECEPAIAWKVLPRMEDDNGDGVLDNAYLGGRLSDELEADQPLDVQLDACPSDNVQWTIDGQPQQAGGACAIIVSLAEGQHTVVAGNADGSDSITIDPEHLMIVGLGDSYGSGEGVPKTVKRGDRKVVKWDQRACHRSRYSAQAQAALRLEKADPGSAVTFLHLACSGAQSYLGVLKNYPDPPGGGEQRAQIEEAAELTLENPVDAVFLSLGGNDIGFADIIKGCALHTRCPLWKANRTIDVGHTGAGTKRRETLHAHTQRLLATLQSNYDTVDACLTALAADCFAEASLGVEPSHVFVTEYPDLARDERGRFCDNVLGPGTIADEEMKWAAQVVQQGQAGTTYRFVHPKVTKDLDVDYDGLNNVIGGLSSNGFTPVRGIFERSRTHGYCSKDTWVVQVGESLLNQGNEFGIMHPNKAGQKAYGRLIADTAIRTLGLD